VFTTVRSCTKKPKKLSVLLVVRCQTFDIVTRVVRYQLRNRTASKMQTAIGYVRVSTEDQASEGVSLEAQKAKLAAWCLANDYELSTVLVDAGLSGGRADNRPGLQAAIEQACKTKSALIVYSLSRLARSTKDTIAIGEKLDKAGADLVSLSEKIDTTSAAGKMIFRMLAVMAEFEKDQISERTKMAMAHKKACGERVGTIPFGFDLLGDGATLVENESEQATIKVIHELRARGLSLRDIATELTTTNRLTKKGNAKWTHTTVKSILNRVA
jgi:site-specific DNA recombinase